MNLQIPNFSKPTTQKVLCFILLCFFLNDQALALDTITQISTSFLDVSSTIASFACVGSSIPIRVGLTNKLIYNGKYLNMSSSQDLVDMYQNYKINVASFPKLDMFDEDIESKPLPLIFTVNGLSSSFLANFWKEMFVIMLGLVSFVALRISQKYYVESYFKTLTMIAFNFLLANLYKNLDNIMFYMIMELKYSKFNSSLSNLSTVLAVFFLLVCLFLIWLYVRFITNYQKCKNQNTTSTETKKVSLKNWLRKNWSLKIFYQDFKDTGYAAQSFLGLFVMRSIFIGLIMASFSSYPLLQTILFLMLTLIVFIALLIFRPFVERKQFLFQVFSEVVVLIVICLNFILAAMDQVQSENYNAREKISIMIIVFNYTWILGGLSFTSYDIYTTVSSNYKSWQDQEKKKENKVHNISEDARFDKSFSHAIDIPSDSFCDTRSEARNQTTFRTNMNDVSNWKFISHNPSEIQLKPLQLEKFESEGITQSTITLENNPSRSTLQNQDAVSRKSIFSETPMGTMQTQRTAGTKRVLRHRNRRIIPITPKPIQDKNVLSIC